MSQDVESQVVWMNPAMERSISQIQVRSIYGAESWDSDGRKYRLLIMGMMIDIS